MIKSFLLIVLLLLTINVVIQKNNQHLIVYFSIFSLVIASLYFFSYAPDVALAEIAVGSAFIPLIFLIAISKQRTFTILFQSDFDFEYHNFLEDFCKKENLKLKIIKSVDVKDDESNGVLGVFRRQDIDVIVDYNPKKKKYIMTCKQSNVMINRFEEIAIKYPKIRVVRIVDTNTLD